MSATTIHPPGDGRTLTPEIGIMSPQTTEAWYRGERKREFLTAFDRAPSSTPVVDF